VTTATNTTSNYRIPVLFFNNIVFFYSDYQIFTLSDDHKTNFT